MKLIGEVQRQIGKVHRKTNVYTEEIHFEVHNDDHVVHLG